MLRFHWLETAGREFGSVACSRMPAKQEAGAAVTLVVVQGAPAAPSPANPWSSVTWFPGMPPLLPVPPHWPTRSVFHGALVASRLYSPVPSQKLEREKAA